MLKITVQKEPKAVAIKLEGRLGGPWVDELRRTWLSLASSLDSEDLRIDLSEVTFVDAAGKHLLTEIRKSGVDLLADTPMIKYLIEQIKRDRSTP